VAALGVAERVVPALRPSEVVDHHPLLAPVPVGRVGSARDATPAAESAWTSVVPFTLLALLGLGGLWQGRRVRA
jgi:hypothetical protein